jgi:pimeloyl-ACP methyl ester carboxylesterase
MQAQRVENGDISLKVAVEGEGPLVVLVHGFPELWYSWRHQLSHLAENGFKAAALDVRGYGESSKPHAIEAYTLRELASDVAAVAAALSDEPAVVIGHDWGAPIAWHTALLHPDRVRAVAGLSVPYIPGGDMFFLDLMDQVYAGKFFYQLYFQKEGPPEEEFAEDLKGNLRRLYFGASGAAPVSIARVKKPRDARLFDGTPAVEVEMSWLSDEDLQVYVDAFAAGGMRGPLNRYRAQRLDFEELTELRGKRITQPAGFIGCSKDLVRDFIPGVDLYADPGSGCEDFRGATLIEGAGHWVQQENPAETNAALLAFVRGL